MKLAKIILLLAVLNLTACATTTKNNAADASVDQRQARSQNLDQQEGASMAATTISPLTY